MTDAKLDHYYLVLIWNTLTDTLDSARVPLLDASPDMLASWTGVVTAVIFFQAGTLGGISLTAHVFVV